MYISADVFAQLLGIKTGELIWALKANNMLKGCILPPSVKKNSALMFDLNEALKFAEKLSKQTGN